MRSSYKQNDVTLLLTDLTGCMSPMRTEEREKRIQSGVNYSEMLPAEDAPRSEYVKLYTELVALMADHCARALATLAEQIHEYNGDGIVLVSLARAGTPIGILLKRFLKFKYNIDVPHYSISIVRGKGIDVNALQFIKTHNDQHDIVFVDGWTGKGAIARELRDALKDFPDIPAQLAVLADPAAVADFYGTTEDLLIPSCCLNSVVSGLISRTIVNSAFLGPNDFHGAAYYEDLSSYDMTYEFIDAVVSKFSDDCTVKSEPDRSMSGIEEALRIGRKYGISDVNFVKPGIGETTRVLLRRVPNLVLIDSRYKDSFDVQHIYELAKQKSVPIKYVELRNYKAVGIIKNLADA